MSLISQEAAKVAMVFMTSALWLKLLIAAISQAWVVPRPPEDCVYMKAVGFNGAVAIGQQEEQQPQLSVEAAAAAAAAAAPDNSNSSQGNSGMTLAQRLDRIFHNDLENFPMALIVFWMCFLVQANQDIYIIAFVLYIVFRVAHSIVYALGLQPWRTLIWQTAKVCEMVAMVSAMVSVCVNYKPPS